MAVHLSSAPVKKRKEKKKTLKKKTCSFLLSSLFFPGREGKGGREKRKKRYLRRGFLLLSSPHIIAKGKGEEGNERQDKVSQDGYSRRLHLLHFLFTTSPPREKEKRKRGENPRSTEPRSRPTSSCLLICLTPFSGGKEGGKEGGEEKRKRSYGRPAGLVACRTVSLLLLLYPSLTKKKKKRRGGEGRARDPIPEVTGVFWGGGGGVVFSPSPSLQGGGGRKNREESSHGS